MTRYQEFPFADFGKGLNLLDKPDAVDPAECIDVMNVIFTDRDALVQRPGFADFSEGLTNPAASLSPFYTTTGTKQLLAGCGSRLEALSSAGAVVKSATGLTSAVWDFARFGKPGEETAYAGNGTDTLRKWIGSEWSAPTATVDGSAGKAMPKAGSLEVWAQGDNRLVVTGFSTTTGGPNGGVSSPSHVYFSDAGNPESYESTASVQLTPGDGERIMAAVVWRELLFVFKETRFFVFDSGVSDDAEGKPEFHFRPVEAGVGMVAPRAICVHPTGVYFMGRQGVYRTTGESPECISQKIEPIFAGGSADYYLGGELAQAHIDSCAMHAFREQIYVAFPTEEANDRTLIYDPAFGAWTLTDLPVAAMCTFRPSSEEELMLAYSSGARKIGRYGFFAYTNDARR